jgi:HEPN domain-containing protein
MRNLEEEAGRWLRQAQSDFRLLAVVRDAGKHDTCCFLAQQAAEKALKAYLFLQGEELLLTHSVFRLCATAAHYDAAFEEVRERAKVLDFYYVEARYPNALGNTPADFYGPADSAQAIEMARTVLEAVQDRMEKT